MSSVCFAGTAGRSLAFAMSSAPTQTKSHHKWVVLYWMPYDNDLAPFGEPIVEMLIHGAQNSETVVAVQSDYWGDAYMRRRQIINSTVTETEISEEDSSDAAALATYLDWAHQTFEAEHWAVIVVGHGGKINQVSPDNHRINGQARTWMTVEKFTDVVSSFNQATDERVELLFFQNCNKATLEIVYEARNCAKYTLASQLALGAPNYYYENFLNSLALINGGREAAMAIMDSESADMYYTLTLVDNQTINHIPEKLSSLLQPISNSHSITVGQSDIPIYYYFGEQHCDVLALFGYLSTASGQDQKELAEFTNFLNSEIIVSHKTGGELFGNLSRENVNSEELCGLSLYLPETEQDISHYSSLALYQETDLASLYRKIIAA